MQKNIVYIVLAALVVLLISGYFLLAPARKSATPSSRPVIVTTILPLTVITKNLAGDWVDVHQLVPSGAGAHDFAFTPAQLLEVQKANIVIGLGLGLDTWINNSVVTAPPKPFLIAGEQINLPQNSDPHVWLSPKKMLELSAVVSNFLQKQYPAQAAEIRAAANQWEQKLQNLDQEYIALRAVPNKRFVSFHNAFKYLATDYGLESVGVIEETPGNEPTPAQIANILQKLNEFPDATLFGEPAVEPAILRAIAEDARRKIYILDPLERGASDAGAYERVMRANLEILRTAFTK